MSTRRFGLAFTMMSLVVLSSIASAARTNNGSTMLVVPARRAAIEMAFSVAWLRPATLVSYQNLTGSENPVLHVWDPTTREWMETAFRLFADGELAGPTPQRVLIVGPGDDATMDLVDAASWATTVKTVPSLRSVPIANAADEMLGFTRREWHWLARRHNLEIQDLNAERRRYGRYGTPRWTFGWGAKRRGAPAGTADSLEPIDLDDFGSGDAEVPVTDTAPMKPVTLEPARTTWTRPESVELPVQGIVVEKGVSPDDYPPEPAPEDK